jgi:UDP-2,3-diacylglucosamine hydrolase
MCPKLEKGAIFIADAHENAKRSHFLTFIKALETGEIPLPPQLFLMGDMFDLLVGEVDYTHQLHRDLIGRIDALAAKIPVYYLEGNHDFNLRALFLHVKVVPIEDQPLHVKTPKGDVLVLHGDKYGSLRHRIFTAVIRSRALLRLLNALDAMLSCRLSYRLLTFLEQKHICQSIPAFREKTSQRLRQYPLKKCVGVLEGHFHQGVGMALEKQMYYNFSSFACDQSYFVVQCVQSIQCAKQQLRGRNV